jgi:hypothetical protein
MGTRTTNQTTKKINCKTCNKEYTPMCDFMQGRCPHHTPMIDELMLDTYKTRYYNLINFFKGK